MERADDTGDVVELTRSGGECCQCFPYVKGIRPCPRAAHAGTTYENKGYVFGGRFQVSIDDVNVSQSLSCLSYWQNTRMNDVHYLDLESGTWSGRCVYLMCSYHFYRCGYVFFRIDTVGIQPQGRSWHSLSVASKMFLFLYGGLNTDNEILGLLLI